MVSKHDPTKNRRQPPLAVAVQPDRSLAPLGSYATVKRTIRCGNSKLAAGDRVLICADRDLKIKRQGDVAVRSPGHRDYNVVPLKVLEIDRPKR